MSLPVANHPVMNQQVTSHPVANRFVTPADLPAISDLHARVFGPGRFARTAYRVREGTPQISPYCRAAFLGSRLIAAVRFTEIAIGGKPGALLLGPLVVDQEFAGQGFGKALVAQGLEHAKASGISLVVLVGDMPYYGRFGFKPMPLGQILFPGPVNPARILAVELQEGAMTGARGLVTPAARSRN